MRCIGCRAKGTFWCESCEDVFQETHEELRDVVSYIGDNFSEGHLVLTAHELLESERLIEMTPLGKASMMARAYELLLEVQDHFLYTPICPGCRTHKMELKLGEPIEATCTGGCVLS